MKQPLYILFDDNTWESAVPNQPPPPDPVVIKNQFVFGGQGWFPGWSDEATREIEMALKVTSTRVGLGEQMFIDAGSKWDMKVPTFEKYAQMGLKDLTAILYQPHHTHKETTKYTGAATASYMFKDMYLPIFNADGSVNKSNHFAWYAYNVIKTYGKYVKFWEVWNEPDLNGGTSIDGGNGTDWLTRMPTAAELSTNMAAPFTHYIRMLRIAREIADKFFPEAVICQGGIGYPNFFDAVCRYTDNPDGGKKTTEFPKTGGEFSDVVSYHIYPHYFLKQWVNAKGNTNFATSDAAAAVVFSHADKLKAVLKKYSLPDQQFICTETGLGKRSIGIIIMTDQMQANFGIKTLAKSQVYGLKALYFYMTGDVSDVPTAASVPTDDLIDNLMGFYENLYRDKPGAQKITPFGTAVKTYGHLTAGYVYDEVATKALGLPATADGIVMTNGAKRLWLLWSKTVVGNESTTADFTLPVATVRHEWDGKSAPAGATVKLTGSPSFFVE